MRSTIEDLLRLVELRGEDAERLARLAPLVEPHVKAVCRRVAARALAVPEVAARHAGDELERALEAALPAWLEELLRGSYDEAYALRRLEMHRALSKHGLPLRALLRIAGILDEKLADLLDAVLDGDAARKTRRSLRRVLDLELALLADGVVEERGRRDEHLALLDTMAASIAHEIRNPLAGISGTMEILAASLPDEDERRLVIAKVQQQIAHMNTLASDLLAFARPIEPRLRDTELDALCGDVVSQIQEAFCVTLPRSVPNA